MNINLYTFVQVSNTFLCSLYVSKRAVNVCLYGNNKHYYRREYCETTETLKEIEDFFKNILK